jgi:hypothetical protein
MTTFNDMVYTMGGVPILPGGMVTGNVFFVGGAVTGATDNVTYGKSPQLPFKTVDYAIGQCTASNGDVIYVMPGHAETCAAAVTCDVAGVSIIGLGRGRNRPALTVTGAIDLVTVTAANVHLENLRLIGAAANCTALLNIAAADLSAFNMVFEPGATPLMTITVASGGHRFHIKNFKVIGTAAGPDAFIDFESSASDDWIVEDGFLNFTGSTDLDLAVFRANVDATKGGFIKNVHAIGLAAAALFVDFNSSHAVGEGLAVGCSWQHMADATIASGLDLGGYGVAYAGGGSDGPNRAAALLPATSAS